MAHQGKRDQRVQAAAAPPGGQLRIQPPQGNVCLQERRHKGEEKGKVYGLCLCPERGLQKSSGYGKMTLIVDVQVNLKIG